MESQNIEQTNQQDTSQEDSLLAWIESVNIAEKLSQEELTKLGEACSEGFEFDLRSREKWEQNLDDWTKLATQVKEEKSWPWRGASNVKYPLLSTAAMQFNARAYPSLVPSTGDIVKCEVIGSDLDGQKLEQSKRVSTFMSYQLIYDMDGWEEDMDKLLIMLPIVGTLFKKTYYSKLKNKNISELILPKNIVVNYWAKNLQDADRVSEIINMNKRQIKERQLGGTYLDIDLGDPVNNTPLMQNNVYAQDNTLPYQIIEQHTFYDLDGDGYDEPYVVIFERATRKVLRVAARFEKEGVELNDEGKIKRIVPFQYYTKFSFIPNPDGGFYDIGFGLLLSPINESVNTLINQLIDAGTLNNLQGGFLGKGLKLKMGEQQWKPGEWKTMQSNAEDLRKQILPLPTKEPSNVLFELMGTLVTSGKELASVAEIFTGKMPGQNTPATTTMATVEQGMKVFTAVYKRIYRSLKEEYKKLFKLNKVYFDPEKYQQVLDNQIGQDDFDEKSYNICPSADPSTPTQTEKLLKAQGLVELTMAFPGILDPVQVISRNLEAQEQPSWQQLFTQQVQQTGQFQPPPDPKMAAMQMKAEIDQRNAQNKMQEAQMKSELSARDQQFQHMMKAQEMAQEARFKEIEMKLEAASQLQKQRIFQVQEAQKVVQKDQQHSQAMRHQEELAKSKQQQIKNSSKNGKSTPSPKR